MGGPVFADALVAAGVYGEILFAGRVRKAEDELRKRSNGKLAAAIDRATEADIEIERLQETAREHAVPRRVDINKFVEEIASLTPGSVEIWYDRRVMDANGLAVSMAGAFNNARWQTTTEFSASMPNRIEVSQIVPWHVPASSVIGQPTQGISIIGNRRPRTEDATDPSSTIFRAIHRSGAGNQVTFIVDEKLGDNAFRLIIGPKALSFPLTRAQIAARDEAIKNAENASAKRETSI